MENKIIRYERSRKIEDYNSGEDIYDDKYFESLGDILFYYSEGKIKISITTIDDIIKDIDKKGRNYLIEEIKRDIYRDYILDIMDGEDFFRVVDTGCIIQYDGSISEIYVDGYKSNLGLKHKSFCQGEFLVDGKTFKNICKDHHVLVNWANK